MQPRGTRAWPRAYGARGAAWGKYGPGSRYAKPDEDDDDDDRTLRSRWVDRIRDRLMLRQHWLEQTLTRLEALEESGGARVWGAPFYTLGGLAPGIGRRERGARDEDTDRERAKDERLRRARERDARREYQMAGREDRERSYAREARAREAGRDRDEVDQDYEIEAAPVTRPSDRPATSPADGRSQAGSTKTSRQRSAASQTRDKARGKSTSRRRP